MAIKPTIVNKHILNIVVGCTEIPFFTVRCMQSFDLSLKFITLIVPFFAEFAIKNCLCVFGCRVAFHANYFFFLSFLIFEIKCFYVV